MSQTKNINGFLERRIERVWRESRDRGWSFSEFAVYALEVLIVLNQREKAQDRIASQQRVAPNID
jgi:hypothetical protein